MFDQLTPEENDTLRAMMLNAVMDSAKLCHFAAPDHKLWERAYGVLTDCCEAIYELAAVA